MELITANLYLLVIHNSCRFWSCEGDELCKAILLAYVLIHIPWRGGTQYLTPLEMIEMLEIEDKYIYNTTL